MDLQPRPVGSAGLQQWRAEQHEDLALGSDHVLAAYLTGCDPDAVARDLTAHSTPVEQRMLHATEGARP